MVDAEIARVAARLRQGRQDSGLPSGQGADQGRSAALPHQILHDVAHELVETRGRRGADRTRRRAGGHARHPRHQRRRRDSRSPSRPSSTSCPPSIRASSPRSRRGARRRRSTTPAVDQALEQLRERAARFEPVEDGVVGDGHTVVVDFERQGFDKDGQAGEKTKHERVPIEIGAAANPPGLDDELKGLAPGAQKTFRLRFPDDYTVTELAGTEVALRRQGARRAPARRPGAGRRVREGHGRVRDARRAARRACVRISKPKPREAAERQVRADVLKKLAGARAVSGARLAGRSRGRSPRRGVRAPADGSADRSAQGQHRLGGVPRSPARAGDRSGRLGARARRDRAPRRHRRERERSSRPSWSRYSARPG